MDQQRLGYTLMKGANNYRSYSYNFVALPILYLQYENLRSLSAPLTYAPAVLDIDTLNLSLYFKANLQQNSMVYYIL